MNREQARKWFQSHMTSDPMVNEAYDIAIEALTEPINCVKCKHYYETEDGTDVHGNCRMDTAHTDLISRADAVERVKGTGYDEQIKDNIIFILRMLPSVSAEAVQGEWIFNPTDAIELMFAKPKCSKCGFESSDGGNFCPNCGADMRGGAE